MTEIPPAHPLRRLFAGITEHAFLTSLGVADPPLIDYLSALLSRFVQTDTLYRLRGTHGQRLTEVVAMLAEAEALPADGTTRREYHRHIGDYTLFWTGLFPESVNKLEPGCRDRVVNFTALGKRSYRIASAFDDDRFRAEAPVLRRLSDEFELCAYGLREVRREWEDLAQHPLPPGSGLIG
jgi:hypothetical protein